MSSSTNAVDTASSQKELVSVNQDSMSAASTSKGASSSATKFDCYPYTFSPLLLFAETNYFDKGYSNYSSVARFFQPALDVDMLANVLYEKKNMRYEELLEHVTTNKMLVTCCIDAHFTAFQVLPDRSLIYYDPLNPNLLRVSGESYNKMVLFLLLKCNYGNSQHIQENKKYYTDVGANATRRQIYRIWRTINTRSMRSLGLATQRVKLNLNRYLLINGQHSPSNMSVQRTGNTCYFQTFLFGVLCRVCSPSLDRQDRYSVDLHNVAKLARITVSIARFLLEFFVEENEKQTKVMRPMTNNNFIVDFHRYLHAPYFEVMTSYLQTQHIAVP